MATPVLRVPEQAPSGHVHIMTCRVMLLLVLVQRLCLVDITNNDRPLPLKDTMEWPIWLTHSKYLSLVQDYDG